MNTLFRTEKLGNHFDTQGPEMGNWKIISAVTDMLYLFFSTTTSLPILVVELVHIYIHE